MEAGLAEREPHEGADASLDDATAASGRCWTAQDGEAGGRR